MRRASVLFVAVVVVVGLVAAPASAGQAIRGHDLDVEIPTGKCVNGHGTATIDIYGVWDDTDIVHIKGTARFRCRTHKDSMRLSSVEFTGTTTTPTLGTITVRGRLLGLIFTDGFESGDVSGLLLPAVQ
jgi:hypothetical protein